MRAIRWVVGVGFVLCAADLRASVACFVLEQFSLARTREDARIVETRGTPTLEVLGGGVLEGGQRLGQGLTEVLTARVRIRSEPPRLAAEKRYFLTSANRHLLDQSVIAAREAFARGLGPEVYGVVDVIFDRGPQWRLVYFYPVGTHPQVVVEQGRKVFGPWRTMREHMNRLTPLQQLEATTKLEKIRARHPDPSDENILAELRRDPATEELVLEIFGIDWDPNTDIDGWIER